MWPTLIIGLTKNLVEDLGELGKEVVSIMKLHLISPPPPPHFHLFFTDIIHLDISVYTRSNWILK